MKSTPSTIIRFYRMRSIVFFALSFLVLTGCTDNPPLSLSPEDRTLMDTLYSREVRVLRPRLDSLCDSLFAAEVPKVVDSLLNIRRQEEARLRQRPSDRVDLLPDTSGRRNER